MASLELFSYLGTVVIASLVVHLKCWRSLIIKYNMMSLVCCKWGQCNLKFKSGNDCYKHVRADHVRVGMTVCLWGSCKKVSSSRCNLANHTIIHMDVVQNICHICARNFKWQSLWRNHMIQHTEKEKKLHELLIILFA